MMSHNVISRATVLTFLGLYLDNIGRVFGDNESLDPYDEMSKLIIRVESGEYDLVEPDLGVMFNEIRSENETI